MSLPSRSTERAARRPLRRFVQSLVSPASFDFWASHVNAAWTLRRPVARIVARHRESHDTVTLVLKPNRHWRGFAPGQHVNVTVEIDGARVTRSYSITSAPRRDRRFTIAVKAIDGGKVSRHLCDEARIGGIVEIGPAFGEMVLAATPDAPLAFLAAGSGITPMIAMLRALDARGMPVPATLVYWVRTRDDRCFVDELRALASRQPSFAVHFVTTRDAATRADEHEGRVDAAQLAALVPDLARRDVYACGPGGFVAAVESLAAGAARSFRAEAFTPLPRAGDAGTAGVARIVLARSGRTLDVPRGQSLLTAFEDAGIAVASGCRRGICNTCACGKSAGSTRHLVTGAVDHEQASALRLCVNAAASDLVLDL